MLCLRQILLSVCLPPTPRSSYACLHLMCKRFFTCTCRIWPKNWQVGVGIHGDAAKLRQDYQIWTHGLVDLSILANAKLTSDPHAVKQWSLSSLAQELTYVGCINRLRKCKAFELETGKLTHCHNRNCCMQQLMHLHHGIFIRCLSPFPTLW